jgi:hypothetical protein
MANMGSRSGIEDKMKELMTAIQEQWVRYEEANSEKDPWKNFEFFLLPMVAAMGAWFVNMILTSTCTGTFDDNMYNVCDKGSEVRLFCLPQAPYLSTQLFVP